MKITGRTCPQITPTGVERVAKVFAPLLSSFPNHVEVTLVATVVRKGLARAAMDYPNISNQKSWFMNTFIHIPISKNPAARVTPNLAPT